MRISAEDLCSLTPYSHLNLRHRISSLTVCYVLAGVSKDASRYLRLKYAGEYRQKKHVINYLARRVYRKQKKQLGEMANPWLLGRMAEVAVDEGLGHGLCRTCNGKGWIDTGIKRIDCFSCYGTGSKHSLGDKQVADRLRGGVLYRTEGEVVMYNTEDKMAWYKHGERMENHFVSTVAPSIGIDVIINPEKKTNKYAHDLILDGTKRADLKHQGTPFFMAGRYDFNPMETVSFNKKDYERYKSIYPDIFVVFWVQWDKQSRYGVNVDAQNGVWIYSLDELGEQIKDAPLHTYQKRIKDKLGNAKDSYLIKLDSYRKT